MNDERNDLNKDSLILLKEIQRSKSLKILCIHMVSYRAFILKIRHAIQHLH